MIFYIVYVFSTTQNSLTDAILTLKKTWATSYLLTAIRFHELLILNCEQKTTVVKNISFHLFIT